MLYRVRTITLHPAQATTYRENGMITETAVNGQAQVIVTFNMRHFGNATSRFGIQVLKPGDFLQKITQGRIR